MEYNKLCRTCLSTSENMTSLYETCAISTQICCAEILSTFTPLICFENDGYPTTICHNCIGELNRCYAFRLKCLESDGMLRNHVENVFETSGKNISVKSMIATRTTIGENSGLHYSDMSSNQNYTTKSLKTPMTLAEMRKDMEQELDILQNNIKIEIDDEEIPVAYISKTNRSLPNQQITNVSDGFNCLSNKAKIDENPSINDPLHCSGVTNPQSFRSTESVDQNLVLIKQEKDLDEDSQVFETVMVKNEFLFEGIPQSQDIKIKEIEDPIARKRRKTNERKKRWLAKQSEESLNNIRAINAAANRLRIAQETPEQSQARRTAMVKAYRIRLAQETPEQTQARRDAIVKANRLRLARETPEQAQARRKANAEANRLRIALETPEQAQARRAAMAEANRLRNAQKYSKQSQERQHSNATSSHLD